MHSKNSVLLISEVKIKHDEEEETIDKNFFNRKLTDVVLKIDGNS